MITLLWFFETKVFGVLTFPLQICKTKLLARVSRAATLVSGRRTFLDTLALNTFRSDLPRNFGGVS